MPIFNAKLRKQIDSSALEILKLFQGRHNRRPGNAFVVIINAVHDEIVVAWALTSHDPLVLTPSPLLLDTFVKSRAKL